MIVIKNVVPRTDEINLIAENLMKMSGGSQKGKRHTELSLWSMQIREDSQPTEMQGEFSTKVDPF